MKLFKALQRSSRPDRPWQSISLPVEVTAVKSMLSAEEKQYLCWLTAEQYQGWGAVVDLGPWLGSSSASLAEGLKRCGSNTRIQSIDLFRWEPSYMEALAPNIGLADGEDFMPAFQQQTAAYSQWIQPRKIDLTRFAWDGGPIEILFVDAAKSWDLTNAIFRGFAPFVEPGRTRVILQDFRYHDTHWLPLIFDSRPDLWQEIESVETGHTVTFLPLKPLDGSSGIDADYSEESFPLASAERLLQSRISDGEPAHRDQYLRMLYRKTLLDGSYEDAQELRHRLLDDGRTTEAEMSSIENLGYILVPRGWRWYGKGDYLKAAAVAEQSRKISPIERVHALTLLGLARLRLDDLRGAREALSEALEISPALASARLGLAEIDLCEQRFELAEQQVLQVLSGCGEDPVIINWVLTLLTQIWTDAGWKEQRDEKLLGLPATVRAHPLFLEFLAREHQRRGEFSQALLSLEHAMQLVSDASEKARLRAEWHTVAAAQPQPSAEHAAGGLHRPEIPDRHPNLAAASLGQLTSEALYRARLGEFGSSEEAILLGLELDDALEHALDVHNNRFSIHRYADLFGSFYEWVGPPSPPLEGATVLDLGCGSLNPLGFLFLLLMLGARRGIAVDLETIHDWPRATTALGSLASAMLVAPQRVIGDRPIQAAQMLHNISSFDLAKFAAGDRTGIDPSRLVYRRESVHSLSLGSGEADVVVSNAFFEHIPSVDQAIAELARVTRPGGMGVHVIDCSDHRRYHDPLVHPLQFLTERHDGELAHGSNRLRPADFVNLFERNGFEVTEVNSFQQTALPNEIRSQLLEPYRSMSDEKLTDTIVKLVVRRRTS